MKTLDKTSYLFTVGTDAKLAEIKDDLAVEGLYFGYYPLDDNCYSLSYYLSKRISNLYFFKYRSIAEQVSSALVEFKNGKSFLLKDAPRAATGPDFNRVIIGSRDSIGFIKEVTLKVTALPEKVSHGIVFVNSLEEAKNLLQFMMGCFIEPLFFRWFDAAATSSLLTALNHSAESHQTLFLFCLTGVHSMVTTEEEVVSEYCQQQKLNLFWVDKKEGRQIINQHLHTQESYRDIREQYRSFLWTSSDINSQNMLEKRFINEFLKEEE